MRRHWSLIAFRGSARRARTASARQHKCHRLSGSLWSNNDSRRECYCVNTVFIRGRFIGSSSNILQRVGKYFANWSRLTGRLQAAVLSSESLQSRHVAFHEQSKCCPRTLHSSMATVEERKFGMICRRSLNRQSRVRLVVWIHSRSCAPSSIQAARPTARPRHRSGGESERHPSATSRGRVPTRHALTRVRGCGCAPSCLSRLGHDSP